MDRLQLSFVALLVLSLSLGGTTAVDVGSSLRAVDATEMVKPRIDVTVTDVTLRDESLAVTAQIRNPTRIPLQLTGVRMRVFNETNTRIASGAGRRLEDNESVVPADGSLTVTYAIGLSRPQHETTADALARGASLSMNLAMELRDANLVVRHTADIRQGRS